MCLRPAAGSAGTCIRAGVCRQQRRACTACVWPHMAARRSSEGNCFSVGGGVKLVAQVRAHIHSSPRTVPALMDRYLGPWCSSGWPVCALLHTRRAALGPANSGRPIGSVVSPADLFGSLRGVCGAHIALGALVASACCPALHRQHGMAMQGGSGACTLRMWHPPRPRCCRGPGAPPAVGAPRALVEWPPHAV